MPLRDGPPPELQQLGGVGQQAAPQVPGLLQMAQSAMGGDAPATRPDGSPWQPAQWSVIPWKQPSGGPMDGRGGGPDSNYDATLPDYYNPAAWGPPPAYVEGNYTGFFPGVFGKSDPNGKYWTMKDYMAQAPKKEGVIPDQDDYSPNTLNPNLISNPASRGVRRDIYGPEPGFMYKNASISRRQIGEALQQGQNPPAGAEGGGNWPPIRSTTRFGDRAAVFGYGDVAMVGLPGLLGSWATMY